jgi:hypothetical protein
MMQAYLARLRSLLETHFNRDELSALCFDLGIEDENAPSQAKVALILYLLKQVTAQNRLADLLQSLRLARSHITWPDPPSHPSPLPVYTGTSRPSPLPNPFGRTGRIQSADYYLLRNPLTEQILHELRKGVSISLVGESQTGKSSLLWYIQQQGAALLPDFHQFIYLSLELIHDDTDFFDYLSGELGLPDQLRGYRLARALRGQRVLLCLDEVEKMTWDGFSLNVRTELRGLADGSSAPLTLLIASRTPLGQLFPDSPVMTSPLAGLCTQMTMPPFAWREVQALVQQYCSGLGLALPESEVEQAWQKTQGHPRQLQQVLKEIFIRLFE